MKKIIILLSFVGLVITACQQDPTFQSDFSFIFPIKYVFTGGELTLSKGYRLTANGYDTLAYNEDFQRYDEYLREQFSGDILNEAASGGIQEIELLSANKVKIYVTNDIPGAPLLDTIFNYTMTAQSLKIWFNLEDYEYVEFRRSADLTQLYSQLLGYTFTYYDRRISRPTLYPLDYNFNFPEEPRAILDTIRTRHNNLLAPGDTVLYNRIIGTYEVER